MEYHCGDCKVDFKDINPDGSCPDCYSALAVERKVCTQDEQKPAEKLPDPPSNLNFPKSFPLQHVHSSAFPSAAPLMAPHLDHLDPSTLQDPFSWNAAPHLRNETDLRGSLNHFAQLPIAQAGLLNGGQPFFQPRSLERHLLRGEGKFFGSNQRPAISVQRFPGQVFHGDSIGRPPFVDHHISLAEQLARSVEQLRAPILSDLDASREVGVLYSSAHHLQKVVEAVDVIKNHFEKRIKTVLGGEISLKQIVYGLEKKSPVLPGSDGTVRKRRERKKTGTVTTIVVKDLPPLTTKGELFRYFSKYCDDVSDLKNVNISVNRGHAYVTVAHESIVGKILSETEEHKIKSTVVGVSAFDDEEQARRRLNYKIFIGGLSSFTSDEAFEDYLWENYGKVDGFWYHPNLQNPGVNNAYAYVTFEDQKLNDDILMAGHIMYNGRKMYCKPLTQQRDYLDGKRRDGTFGPNWRDRTEMAGGTVAPPFSRLTRNRLNSNTEVRGGNVENVGNGRKDGKADREETKSRVRHASADNQQSGTLCLVCYINEIRILLKPCGHACLCEGCADNMYNCPYCRGEIATREKVYLVGSG